VKKFLIIGALALGLAAVSVQEASAWIKCNFSIGLNWSWESGNNSFLWGLWSSGQVPGYPSDAFNGFHANPSPYVGMGGPMPYGDHGGYAPPAPHGGNGFVAPPPGQTAEPPTGKNGNTGASTSQYGASGYQPVGYYQAPAYYQTPSYGSPSYGSYGGQGYGYGSYGNYQVPSYWYGY
jgi:hypothetical protein